jgi:beta-N-acetylhexosaminidase
VAEKALADRVAELIIFGFQGTSAQDIPADLVAEAAGVILFRRNIQSAEQLRALTTAIRERSGKTRPLVAIDQEGGTVSRLAQIGTTTPSAMALGAVRDPAATESMYRLVGDELHALGINVNLAPVADLNNNPGNPVIGVRSFGDDSATVSLHVGAAVRGMHAASIAATAKHFPGHGDTDVDSHYDLPSIPHGLAHVRSMEIIPFVAAIREQVDLIMTAHVLFPAIEQHGKPATLSHRILTGLLRDELHFEGVTLTDCLEMKAIEARYTPEEAAVEAIAAGADLVLFSHTPEKAQRARDALRAALESGRLDASHLRRSLERVAKLRTRLPSFEMAPALDVVGSAQHQAAALAVARRAVTLIRDPKQTLPFRLNKGERLLVVEFAGSTTEVEDEHVHQRTAIGPALASTEARLHEQVRSLDPAGHEYKQLLMASGTAAAAVTLTCQASHHPMQARAVNDLAMLGKRVVAVAGREPYDAMVLSPDLAVIASFGEDANAMTAAAEVILGALRPSGKLPVNLAVGAEALG